VVEVSVIVVPPPTGARVTEYPVIEEPPFDVGAAVLIVADVADVAAALVIAGAVGGAAGVVIVEPAVVARPSPTAFVATVEILY
jgi:hypothetical protein